MSSSRSTFARAAIVGVVGIVLGLSWEPDALGQACCASAGLVAPTHLRSYEHLAVGTQLKARSVFGSFDQTGAYRGSTAGTSDWMFEQDLFGVARLFDRAQVALMLPFVVTRRTVPGLGETGGGLGDMAAHLRYDFISAGEHRIIPGIALLAGLVAPTGTPPENAGDPLAAGATGQGSFETSLGLAVEQALGDNFAAANAMVGLRSSRQVGGIRESFAPRWTLLVTAGRVLGDGTSIGAFASAVRHGENRDDGGPIPGSDLLLLTTGLAAARSVWSDWRFQGTISANLPVRGAGRNQSAGVGASLSLIRLWL